MGHMCGICDSHNASLNADDTQNARTKGPDTDSRVKADQVYQFILYFDIFPLLNPVGTLVVHRHSPTSLRRNSRAHIG